MPAVRGKGKARKSNTKKHYEFQEKESLYLRPRGRKRTNILHRVQSRNADDVNDLIYGFLGNLAALSNNQRHSKSKRFKVPGMKIKRQSRARKNKTNNRLKRNKLSFGPFESPSRLSNDSAMSETMDSATSKASSVYDDDSTAIDSDAQEPVDSKKGIKELMRRKSLVEIINNYIKSGIKADMKKEKRYIKKALSFGVNAGYLRPIDNSGHLLEVSSELPGIMLNGKRDTVAERKRRKNMRRGIVSFDDYNPKSVKQRATKKETEKRHKETNTNVLKKRERSISSVNQPTSKIASKRNDKKPPPKKKAKIARQSRPSRRSSKRMRRRRSPTPWRNSNLCEKDDESPVDNRENDQEKDCCRENKNDNESNNSTTDATENRKPATTLFRKDDSKNHQNNSANGSVDNFSAEIQPSIESTQEGDKQ